MTTDAEIESKVASAILHSVQNGCDMTPREALVAAKAAIAALSAGYAAGIEDAAKVADTFAQFKRETPDSRDVHLLTATDIAHSIRSLPQPAPAEDALRLIHDTFAKDIEQGYVTADKTFAVEIARQALTGTKGDAVKVWPSGTVRLT